MLKWLFHRWTVLFGVCFHDIKRYVEMDWLWYKCTQIKGKVSNDSWKTRRACQTRNQRARASKFQLWGKTTLCFLLFHYNHSFIQIKLTRISTSHFWVEFWWQTQRSQNWSWAVRRKTMLHVWVGKIICGYLGVVGTCGIKALCEMLKVNTTLTELGLSCNNNHSTISCPEFNDDLSPWWTASRIGIEAVAALSEMLCINTTLRSLDLSRV